MNFRASSMVVFALIGVGLWGCGDEQPKPDKESASDSIVAFGSGDVIGQGDVVGQQGGAVVGGIDAAQSGDGGVPLDVVEAIDGGSGAVSIPCQKTVDCAGKMTTKACQKLSCVAGACARVTKPGACCVDSDCDDGDECTQDACPPGTISCTHKAIDKCCTGHKTMLQLGFESPGTDGLIVSAVKDNGNVQWQSTSKRSHAGKSSLYLGNACGTYDNSMSSSDGCAAVPGKTKPVSVELSTKPLTLPKDKPAHLHFWFYADVEPMYADGFPAGNCSAKPCGQGSSCVLFNGSSTCLPEKDVLTVKVAVVGGKVSTVFDATEVGKSTQGKWRRVAINLAGFAGQQVSVRWSFATGTALNNGYEGVYLDEVTVETVCDLQTAGCSKTKPCQDDQNPCSVDTCGWYSNQADGGACFHDLKPGCCVVDTHCDDGKGCTQDLCADNQCTHSPDSTKAGCCTPLTLLADNFDSGKLDGWLMVAGNSSAVKWRIDPKGGKAMGKALYFGNAGFDGYADSGLAKGVGAKGMACIAAVSPAKGTHYNLLEFELRLDTEWSFLPAKRYEKQTLPGAKKFDHLEVMIDDGVKLQSAWSSDLIYGTTDGNWRKITVVLDPWQGQKVKVCLAFDAGDDQVNDKVGVHVDDLQIKVACTKKSCYFDGQCPISCSKCSAPFCSESGCKCMKEKGC